MSDLSSTMAAPDSSLSAALRAVAERGALALVAALGTNAFIVWVVRATAVVESLPQLAYAQVSVLTAVGVIGASVVYAVLDWRFSRLFGRSRSSLGSCFWSRSSPIWSRSRTLRPERSRY